MISRFTLVFIACFLPAGPVLGGSFTCDSEGNVISSEKVRFWSCCKSNRDNEYIPLVLNGTMDKRCPGVGAKYDSRTQFCYKFNDDVISIRERFCPNLGRSLFVPVCDQNIFYKKRNLICCQDHQEDKHGTPYQIKPNFRCCGNKYIPKSESCRYETVDDYDYEPQEGARSNYLPMFTMEKDGLLENIELPARQTDCNKKSKLLFYKALQRPRKYDISLARVNSTSMENTVLIQNKIFVINHKRSRKSSRGVKMTEFNIEECMRKTLEKDDLIAIVFSRRNMVVVKLSLSQR